MASRKTGSLTKSRQGCAEMSEYGCTGIALLSLDRSGLSAIWIHPMTVITDGTGSILACRYSQHCRCTRLSSRRLTLTMQGPYRKERLSACLHRQLLTHIPIQNAKALCARPVYTVLLRS